MAAAKPTRVVRIASSTTTKVVEGSCIVHQIYSSATNAGTTWTARIQDRASPPNVLLPDTAVTIGTSDAFFDEPLSMTGGVDIVTVGGSPGEVFFWVTYSQ